MTPRRMSRSSLVCQYLFLSVICGFAVTATGTGITADAGLTPPADRWIFRSQVRYMSHDDDPMDMDRSMTMLANPFVLAYGLRPNVTVLARQIFYHRAMHMMGSDSTATGRGDLFLLSKWRMLRINRRDYIVGVAPTFGIELPTGDDTFGSDTWDLTTGAYFTGRRGPLGADLNLAYRFNGIDDRYGSDGRPGDEFTANLALAYQFTLDEDATMSLWPVVELSYTDTAEDRMDGRAVMGTGGDLLQCAMGMKFARQSLMFEALLQIPLQQRTHAGQLERQLGGLIGVRYLF